MADSGGPPLAQFEKLGNGVVTMRCQIEAKVFYWEFGSVTELLQFLHDLAKIGESDTRQLRPPTVAFLMKFPRRPLRDLARLIQDFLYNRYPEYAWGKQLREDFYMAAQEANHG